MTVTLQDLLNAGLPALTCDGQDATWSRELSAQEWEKVFDLFHPEISKPKAAKADAAAIPNWATWSKDDWATYYNANLSSTQVTAVANLADAKAMLAKQNTVINALAQMVIALRNYTRVVD